MADPAVKRPADGARDQSLGSLVSLAVSDVSQLLKYELDLAKLELKADVRRLGIAGALMGMAAFVGCLVLVLLCFAFAYGLITLGIWSWAAFLIVAGTCVVLAGVGGLFLDSHSIHKAVGRRQMGVVQGPKDLRGNFHPRLAGRQEAVGWEVVERDCKVRGRSGRRRRLRHGRISGGRWAQVIARIEGRRDRDHSELPAPL